MADPTALVLELLTEFFRSQQPAAGKMALEGLMAVLVDSAWTVTTDCSVQATTDPLVLRVDRAWMLLAGSIPGLLVLLLPLFVASQQSSGELPLVERLAAFEDSAKAAFRRGHGCCVHPCHGSGRGHSGGCGRGRDQGVGCQLLRWVRLQTARRRI